LHEALKRLAVDEIFHASIAWRTLNWACEKGGKDTRQAVEEAFQKRFSLPEGGGCEDEIDEKDTNLIAYGRLPKSTQLQVGALATELLVKPWSRLVIEGRCFQVQDPSPGIDNVKIIDLVSSSGNAILAHF